MTRVMRLVRGATWPQVIRGSTRAATIFALCALALVESAAAQNEGDPSTVTQDSLHITGTKEPVSYRTTYNHDQYSGNWLQLLSYSHNAPRFSLGLTGSSNTSEGLRGLTTNGVAGELGGNVTFKATNQWLWSIDGGASVNTNEGDRSKTTRRQNRLQVRTQYSFNPSPRLSGVGILFGELQGDQSLGSSTIPSKPLMVIDSTVTPHDTTFYQAHTSRDSSYTVGLRDGVSGSIRWAPAAWLEVKGLSSAAGTQSKTRALTRDFWAIDQGDGATLVTDTLGVSEAPNGDQQYEASATYTGLRRTSMGVVLKNMEGDQEYYALNRRGQERLSYGTRSGSIHLETRPLAVSQFTIDASLTRSLREYTLQPNLNTLVNAATAAASFTVNKTESRASLGFQVGRTRNDRQVSQNGTVINRSLIAMGATRVSSRLRLDASGSIGLFSKTYDNAISNRDDLRGSGIVGGGYRVSGSCSTTVHFSKTRAHAVALDSTTSADNNVQTTYQMDATLRLQVTRSFLIFQNYSLNANYQIYDYDEARNILTRIRRIATVLSDSLFSFGSMRLTHYFYFQDRGLFTRGEDAENRTYSVANELYQQTLSLTLGVRPCQGIVFTATQSLSNTRNYITNPANDTNSNQWNLNVGAVVDRPLPGDMTLQGSVQHIGLYTERPGILPPTNVDDYWVAEIQFTKDF